MAFANSISASRYLPSSKYAVPLSKYFCFMTCGSREHPASALARTATPNQAPQRSKSRFSSLIVGVRVIWLVPEPGARACQGLTNVPWSLVMQSLQLGALCPEPRNLEYRKCAGSRITNIDAGSIRASSGKQFLQSDKIWSSFSPFLVTIWHKLPKKGRSGQGRLG